MIFIFSNMSLEKNCHRVSVIYDTLTYCNFNFKMLQTICHAVWYNLLQTAVVYSRQQHSAANCCAGQCRLEEITPMHRIHSAFAMQTVAVCCRQQQSASLCIQILCCAVQTWKGNSNAYDALSIFHADCCSRLQTTAVCSRPHHSASKCCAVQWSAVYSIYYVECISLHPNALQCSADLKR